MFMLAKKPANRGHREYRLPRLLSTHGKSTYNQKTSSTVEPCFEYASYPIAFRLADEIDSDSYTDVATTLLRRLYMFGVACLRDTAREELEASIRWGEGPKVDEVEAERVVRADEEAHEEACGAMAMAMAQPVSLPDDEPPLAIVRLRAARPEVTEDVKSPAEPVKEESSDESDGTDSDTDSDEDSDSESSDDSTEGSKSSTSSTSSFFTRPVLRRSPLAQSSDGLHPVYAGYHCTIQGCSFKASTPQHVRHHMLTASHWYLLDEE